MTTRSRSWPSVWRPPTAAGPSWWPTRCGRSTRAPSF
jgi:hypothetical protein